MNGMSWFQNLLFSAAMALLLFCSAGRVDACVEGLAWGMPLETVTNPLGDG